MTKIKVSKFGWVILFLVWALCILYPVFAHTQTVYNYQIVLRTAVSNTRSANITATGAAFHQITWNKTDTLNTCSVKVDSSADGITWNNGDVIAAQNCTSNGQAISSSIIPNYVRINATIGTGGGALASVLDGFSNNPLIPSSEAAGLVITSAGIPSPGTVTTAACPPGQGVFSYIKKADGTYQDVQSLDITTVNNPASPAGTINDCWRHFINDSGIAIPNNKNRLVGAEHYWGHGGVLNSAANDESVFAATMTNGDPAFQNMHQALTFYSENVLINTPTFSGHAGGEVSASAFRGNTTDIRTGVLSGADFNVFSGQFEKQTTSVYPSGLSGVYWGIYSNEAGGNQSGVIPWIYGGQCGDVNGTDTVHSCAVFKAYAPTGGQRFPTSNYGYFSGDFGTPAADYDFFANGVNAGGTPSGFNAFIGPTSFGVSTHPANGDQIAITGKWSSTDLLRSYNGITTDGLSFPVQVKRIRAVAQVAAIGTTTLLTTGAAIADYLIIVSTYCTTTSAAATVTPTIRYTDTGSQAQTITPSPAACTALGASSFNLINSPIVVKNATNIQYETAIVNTPTYDLRIDLYQLGVN